MISEQSGYTEEVAELRSEKVTVTMTPTLLARIDAYREDKRWTRSTAIVALVEEGIERAEQAEGQSP